MDKTTNNILNENARIIDFLKQSRYFADVSEKLLVKLSVILTHSSFEKDAVILKQGATNDRVYFLFDGWLGIYVNGEHVSTLKRKGDLVGEMSVIANNPVSADVVALNKVTLFSFPAQSLNRDFEHANELDILLFWTISRILTDKLRLTSEKAKQFEIANRELEQARASLLSSLTEKTALLTELGKTNQDLRNSQASLVLSAKLSAIGEISSNMAHEINQPLNGIKIISQSILRDIKRGSFEEDLLEEDLTYINEYVDKMSTVVQHMRVFTEQTENKSPVSIDVSTVVCGALALTQQQLKNHDIDVVIAIDESLPSIRGLLTDLEQAVMSLISNARKALDSSGLLAKRLEIRAYKFIDSKMLNQTAVVIAVKDNVGAIAADIREKIFEPFFTTGGGATAGLGLSIAKKTVGEHNGRIELVVVEGEMTEFKIILPQEEVSD